MSHAVVEKKQELAGPERTFWEDELELCLDPWLDKARDKTVMRGWVEGLTKRQVRVLCLSLHLDPGPKLQDQREAIRHCKDQLTQYYLVDRFAYRRSKFATADFASTVLSPAVIDECRAGEDGFDTEALLFALYQLDPAHLRTVFHLEKVHSTGFARMKLKGKARRSRKTFQEFLQPEIVEHTLNRFDADHNDGRSSEFKNIVAHGEHHFLFIRREQRRAMLLKSRHAVHGFKPEWIVLGFRNHGKGVDISSLSMSAPVEIAERLASAYFGRQCEYENEVEVTYKAQIEKFLAALRRDDDGPPPLVEVAVKNSALDGAPSLRISSDDGESIAESVRHFEKAVGRILGDIDLIKSIKVLFSGKRVKLLFEPVEGVKEGYVVRYTDSSLNATEREVFVTKLRGEPHGLRILPSEKRHKQQEG